MKHITAPWLLINSEVRIIIQKDPKKNLQTFAQQGKPQEGGKGEESIVK